MICAFWLFTFFFLLHAQENSYHTINIIAPTFPAITNVLEKLPETGTGVIINYTPPLFTPHNHASSMSAPFSPYTFSLRQKCTYLWTTFNGQVTFQQFLVSALGLYSVINSYCFFITYHLRKNTCWSLWKKSVSSLFTKELLLQELARRFPHQSIVGRLLQLEQECEHEIEQLHRYKKIAQTTTYACMLPSFIGDLWWHLNTYTLTPLSRLTLSFSALHYTWVNKVIGWIQNHYFLSIFSFIKSSYLFYIDEKIVETIPERLEQLHTLKNMVLSLREKQL